MKKIRTVLAFLLVFVLMFGNSARAFAADSDNPTGTDGNTTTEGTTGDNNGSTTGGDTVNSGDSTGKKPDPVQTGNGIIEIDNATQGKTYAAYKLFDATYSMKGSELYVAYTINKEAFPEWYDELTNGAGKDFFTVHPTADKNGNYAVERKGTRNAEGEFVPSQRDEDLIAYLRSLVQKGEGEHTDWFTKIVEFEADKRELKFEGIPYGYYFVTSEVGTLVSINTASPYALIVDKNQEPEFDKYIFYGQQDEEGNDIKVRVNQANLDETIPYKIVTNTTNYYGDEKIYRYVVYDDLDLGMSYITPVTVTIEEEGKEIRILTVGEDYTIQYYSDQGFTDPIEIDGSDYSPAQGFIINIEWAELIDEPVAENEEAEPTEADGEKPEASPAKLYGESKYTSNAVLTVTYSAVLDPEKAYQVIYGVPTDFDGNTNKAEVKYLSGKWDSPPPPPESSEPEGSLGKRKTETFTSDLAIHKVDDKNEPLPGAEFTLTGSIGKRVLFIEEVFEVDENGTYWKLKDNTYTQEEPTDETAEYYDAVDVKYTKTIESGIQQPEGTGDELLSITGTIDGEGNLTFKGLGVGNYTLAESKVPDGYIRWDDITFSVGFECNSDPAFNPETGEWTFGTTEEPVEDSISARFFIADANGDEVENSPIELREVTGLNSLFGITIVNIPGVRLPSVGGRGTVAFYLIGGAMVIGAAAMLVMKRRRREEE